MLISWWHSLLDMEKHELEWHIKDVEDELSELTEAKSIVEKVSERSDVVYTVTRAWWGGHKSLRFPLSKPEFLVGLIYMFPKYTLRWLFYYYIGKSFDRKIKITEVRNPKKIYKLKIIAKKYNLDENEFVKRVSIRLKRWIFLP